MKLTDTAIKKARAREKAYSMSDGEGLFLRIAPSGGKLWRWKYRYEGKEKLMSFGGYPDVSLAEARERHREARKLLASGIDPMAQRKALKTAERLSSGNSFASIADLWLKHWQCGKSPRHALQVERRLHADILPRLGTRPIADIKAPEVVGMAKAIQGRGARDIAKRALETTGQIFGYAIAHGYAEHNPAKQFKPSAVLQSAPKTNYARIDAKELPALLKRIEVYQGAPVTRLAIKLIALTFVRTTELIEAKWSEFDLEAGRWDIPAARMKMRTPHIVPLAKQALEVLGMLHEVTGQGELLFPGDRNARKPMSNNTILKALERMGYKHRMTGHGFRGLASTVLHEQGWPHEHIELQLAHAPRNAVSAAYNHATYLEPRAKMMQEWADYLERSLREIKVIPMRDRVA